MKSHDNQYYLWLALVIPLAFLIGGVLLYSRHSPDHLEIYMKNTSSDEIEVKWKYLPTMQDYSVRVSPKTRQLIDVYTPGHEQTYEVYKNNTLVKTLIVSELSKQDPRSIELRYP